MLIALLEAVPNHVKALAQLDRRLMLPANLPESLTSRFVEPSRQEAVYLPRPLRGEFGCDWRGRPGRSFLFGCQRNVPRQQRLVLVGGLSQWQGHEQGLQIAVRVDCVDLAGLCRPRNYADRF